MTSNRYRWSITPENCSEKSLMTGWYKNWHFWNINGCYRLFNQIKGKIGFPLFFQNIHFLKHQRFGKSLLMLYPGQRICPQSIIFIFNKSMNIIWHFLYIYLVWMTHMCKKINIVNCKSELTFSKRENTCIGLKTIYFRWCLSFIGDEKRWH